MDPTSLATQISQLDSSYNPVDTYNHVTSSLGIPDARTRALGLQKQLVDTQNAIDAVDPSVTGRTSGSLVTEAQRGRLVNMEKAPLTNTYTKEGQQLGQANTNLTSLLGEADRQTNAAKSDYQTKRNSLATQLDLALKQKAAEQAAAQHQADQEFTASENAKNRAAKGGSGGGGGGSSEVGSALQVSSGNRKGAYNFTDANGNPISARLYAQNNNLDFNKLLQKMAVSGDSGARDVLNKGAKSAAYKALTWG